RITDFSGAPIGGVTVSAGSDTRTETDADGNYVFANLSGGTSYTITPTSVQGGDRFEPRFVSFPASEGDKVADFKGAREQFTISGQVVDGAGSPASATVITLTGGGLSISLGTDGQGRYSVPNLPGGYTYAISAVNPGVTISPATRRVLLSRNL